MWFFHVLQHIRLCWYATDFVSCSEQWLWRNDWFYGQCITFGLCNGWKVGKESKFSKSHCSGYKVFSIENQIQKKWKNFSQNFFPLIWSNHLNLIDFMLTSRQNRKNNHCTSSSRNHDSTKTHWKWLRVNKKEKSKSQENQKHRLIFSLLFQFYNYFPAVFIDCLVQCYSIFSTHKQRYKKWNSRDENPSHFPFFFCFLPSESFAKMIAFHQSNKLFWHWVCFWFNLFEL